MVALHPEDGAQALDVGGAELAVAGLRAGRLHQTLLLEEAELAVGEVGELRREARQHLPDAEETGGAGWRRPGGGRRHYSFVRPTRSVRDA